jgi:hypothetical protein
VTLLLYTALRLHELVDLDIGDASISARKGLLVVRSRSVRKGHELLETS